MINILFFAKYREQAGVASMALDNAGLVSVAELIEHLKQEMPACRAFLDDKHLLVAVNQESASPLSIVSNDDEVAFYPPVTGG